MNILSPINTQFVSAGQLAAGDGKHQSAAIQSGLIAAAQAQSSLQQSAISAITFSPSHPEGMPIHLRRFDVNFMAPSDNESDELSLFPGLNDQGGVV